MARHRAEGAQAQVAGVTETGSPEVHGCGQVTRADRMSSGSSTYRSGRPRKPFGLPGYTPQTSCQAPEDRCRILSADRTDRHGSHGIHRNPLRVIRADPCDLRTRLTVLKQPDNSPVRTPQGKFDSCSYDLVSFTGLEAVTSSIRRDGRAVEGGCLENNCGRKLTGGSNPSPSACERSPSILPGRCRSTADRERLLSACTALKLYRGFKSLPPRLGNE